MSSYALPALHVNPPQEQPGPLDQYGKLLQLKHAIQQGQIGQEQLKGAQLQNQQTQQDQQDQQTIKSALQQTGGDMDKALPLLAGKINPKTQISLEEYHQKRQSEAFALEASKRAKDQADNQQLMGLISQAQALSPNQYAQQYPSIVEQATKIKPSLAGKINPNQMMPQEALSSLQLGLMTEDQYFKKADEAAKAKKAPFEQQKAEADAATAQADATIKTQDAALDPVARSLKNQSALEYYASQGNQAAKKALDEKIRVAQASRPVNVNRNEVAEALDTAAQSLANGDLTRLKDIASLRGDQRILVYNKAKKLNPNFNTAEVDRKIKMEDAFTNGKDGQNLQSFGTFLEHGGEASDVVNQIRNSDSKLINKSVNWWRNNMSGDPRYQQLVSALEPVRKEFEGFLLGGRALYGDDRKAAETILSDDSGVAAIQGALKQMGHTVKARYNEANFRYKRVMGKNLEDAVSPEAIEGARKIGVDMGVAAPNQTGSSLDKFWKQ